MASDLCSTVEAVNGINLANYFPYKHSYNSVLYVHKNFLSQLEDTQPQPKEKEQPKKELKKKVVKEKVKKVKRRKGMMDKSIQFNGDLEADAWIDNKTYKVKLSDDSLLEQTIKFAKNIVPIAIPPSRDRSPPPVYYTIRAMKTKKRKCKDTSQQTHDVTYKKEKSKKVVETFRNEKGLSQREESFSVKETVSYASQNDTLDELHNINSSLCCSFSDASENKHAGKEIIDNNKKSEQARKETVDKKYRHKDLLRFAASESFEALATDFVSQSGDAKVKIHLMNESDRNMFSENISLPVITALKECLSEIHNRNDMSNEITTVQRLMKSNTKKLDSILDRLAGIEKKLDELKHTQAKPISPKVLIKPSNLETLGEDIIEDQVSSEEECYQEDLCERKRARGTSTVVQLVPQINGEMNRQHLGNIAEATHTVFLGAKPERSTRIPARFCWTDAAKKNMT